MSDDRVVGVGVCVVAGLSGEVEAVTEAAEIVAFLTARYDDEERLARAAADEGRPDWEAYDLRPEPTDPYRQWALAGPDAEGWGDRGASAKHAAYHDPVRVLAEVDAKRRLLAEHREGLFGYTGLGSERCETCDNYEWPCPTVQLLALPYASHSDYRPEWRPA